MIYRLFIVILVLPLPRAGADYAAPSFPFAPAAGNPGSSAVYHEDPAVVSWADSVVSIVYGDDVDEQWQVPQAALGPADGNGFDVLVLGRGGSVTLQFMPPIRNGEGDDFAVFENGISDYFLELAYVEVSSDGLHFVRFPAYSYTDNPVPAFGTLDPVYLHGLASKYRAGYGTPFDLQVLADAHAALLDGYEGFSADFGRQLLENFPFLDLEAVRYVRLIDIPGDGTAPDCQGWPIYDPYKTVASAGFDLDAVAVLNQAGPGTIGFADWSSGFALSAHPEADTDRDGWDQWLEYRMGSSPVDSASIPLIEMRLLPDGILELHFTQNRAAAGKLEIQIRNAAGDWIPWSGAWELIEDNPAPDQMVDRYRVRETAGSEPLLIRFAGSSE